MPNGILSRPFALHDLTLPNRIVLAPMTRSRAGVGRIPNTLMAEYHAQRSSAGLLIIEATTISEEANGWNESPASTPTRWPRAGSTPRRPWMPGAG